MYRHPTLTQRLARLALEKSESSPSRRLAAVRSLFDYCACAVAGGTEVESSWALDAPARLAVRAHARDLDDLHLGTATHPGGVIWSAVVPCALERDAELGDTLAAAAFGYEVAVRLGAALGPKHRQSWHATTTLGVVAAAGAAARLLSAQQEAIVDALGHAISVSGGSSQAMIERSGTRSFHRAHAAGTGVRCALAASSGVRATAFGLESGRGAFAEARSEWFADELLGARPLTAIEETGFRLYAATGFAHSAMDAAAMIGDVEPAAIERVDVTVSPATRANASNKTPADDQEAWWSVEHAVASTLCVGEPEAVPAGLSRRPEVVDVCRRVELVEGADGWGATVRVALADGDVRSATVAEPHGHVASPASSEDLCRKWRTLVGRDGSRFLVALSEAVDATPFREALDAAADAGMADLLAVASSMLR